MNNSSAESDFVLVRGVPLKCNAKIHKIDVFDERVSVFGQKKNNLNRNWGGKYAVCFPLFLTLPSSIKQWILNWFWFFMNINLHVVYISGKNCLPLWEQRHMSWRILGNILNMTHSQMLGKFEYTGGPIFKVVLEC